MSERTNQKLYIEATNKVQELYEEIAKTRNSIIYIREQVACIAEEAELSTAIYEAGGVDRLLYILNSRLEHLLENLTDEYDFETNYTDIIKDNL
jgi:hypothetical protein